MPRPSPERRAIRATGFSPFVKQQTSGRALGGQQPESLESQAQILTQQEVAAWLKIHPRQVQRLRIPCLNLGHKTKRYLAEDVQDWLETLRHG